MYSNNVVLDDTRPTRPQSPDECLHRVQRGIVAGAKTPGVVHQDDVVVGAGEDDLQLPLYRRVQVSVRRDPSRVVTIESEEGRPLKLGHNRLHQVRAVSLEQRDAPPVSEPGQRGAVQVRRQLDRHDLAESLPLSLDRVSEVCARLNERGQPECPAVPCNGRLLESMRGEGPACRFDANAKPLGGR